MGLSEGGAPVSPADGEDGKLGNDDGGADSCSYLLRGLDTETDVALRVADNNDRLKAGTLAGAGLLLDGLDLEVVRIAFISPIPLEKGGCRKESGRGWRRRVEKEGGERKGGSPPS